MSAFACEPGRGSEQEVGWRWALEMARWFDVTVLTQERNRPRIEEEVARGLPDGLTLSFEYFQLAEPVYRLKSRSDPLTWPYYAWWQWSARQVVRRLHAEKSFALAHHVTFVSFRVPVWIKVLKIPVVFGPVGGADIAPYELLKRGFGPTIRCKEILRNLLTGASAALMNMVKPISRGAGVCLAATPSMARLFELAGLPHEIFPAVGVDCGMPGERDPKGSRRFLFVGRFHPLKGTHLLLEAFARACMEGARLTLIASGRDEGKLRELADSLGISERLEWLGKLPREQLPAQYRRHDVLVAPSLYESGGLVALEAMAEGLPVVALDVGGHAVSVADGCGIRVPADGGVEDVIDGLADAMKAYADDPDRVVEDGRRAQERIAEQYSWSAKAARMRQIYTDLISSTTD